MPERGRDFTVRASNNLETLLEALAASLRKSPAPPLERETVVVQSQGMRRWLTLQLARKLGCAASLRLPFPADFCHQLTGGTPERQGSFFSREVLVWRVLGLLEELRPLPEFAPLAACLRGGDGLEAYQLAARAAHVFDNYQIYRPELLQAWEEGKVRHPGEEHEPWQAELWRRLTAGCVEPHLGKRFAELIRRLERGGAETPLPRRISVFGVNSLPPVFLDLLYAASLRTRVEVYVVSPTCGPDGGGINRLLASFATQSADYFRLLHGLVNRGGRWVELPFRDSGRENLLCRIQSDVLCRRNPGDEAADAPLPGNDASLAVHCCHGPLRELEVLRDELLAAFAADPTLRPDEVVVLLADAEKYAPYAEAAFGAELAGQPRLPYAVSDHPEAEGDPAARGLLRLLELPESRFEKSRVLALLECGAFAAAAGLEPAEVAQFARLMEKLNVRWGVDGRHRARAFGLPDEGQNSWRAGLDRLLLGAVTGETGDLVAGILPYAGATGVWESAAGRFAAWFDRLAEFADAARGEREVTAWAGLLEDALENFFAPAADGDAEALERLRELPARLRREATTAGFAGRVGLATVRDWVKKSLAGDGFGGGFLSGRITVCAFKPMRTIPFKVVAMCGMDFASFPRSDHAARFDLQAAYPRPGDRSLRDDDREQFLEFVLAAGKRLIVTYPGRSEKDNSLRAPSVCLSELLDYAGQYRDRAELVREHRLQPFDRAYFTPGSGLRSYNAEYANWSSARPGGVEPAFCQERIETPGELRLSLEELAQCLVNPCRFFCERTLGVFLDRETEEGEEVEPFALAGLGRYQAREYLAGRRVEAGECDPERERRILAARGILPPAGLGCAWAEVACAEAGEFAARVGRTEFAPPLDFALSGPGWSLHGAVEGVRKDCLLHYRCVALRPRDLLRAWVHHLALTELRRQGFAAPEETRLVCLDGEATLGAVERPGERLAEFVNFCLAAAGEAKPFFEKSSYAYARKFLSGKAGTDPLQAALAEWRGSEFSAATPDSLDPYVALCFRGREPLRESADEFRRLAEKIWQPLLECLHEE